MSRGQHWFDALTQNMQQKPGPVPSVCVADGELAGRPCRVILVRPDAANPFPRARSGEVGLLEGWALAKVVQEATGDKRTLLAIVDVPSQAYGRREEALGIHQALAAAAGAYAKARQAGHPVLALLVGKAMSGAFLAHGYQANAILALDDAGVMVHAMGKAAAARVTQRSEEDLDRLAASIPPMAYDLKNYASLGLLSGRIAVSSAEAPTGSDLDKVNAALAAAQQQALGSTSLAHRLDGENRRASKKVRQLLRQQWALQS
ncbi:biotin-independent malonate decarboxylase subunit gamma [Gallaecimonas pentaromativorans]|uniref:biotin-independent malonate decarboxylase subunit gamma n=1 Tax=Gallaecimonas pentaromativorans TaxID=584787 RepID=UPI003A943521